MDDALEEYLNELLLIDRAKIELTSMTSIQADALNVLSELQSKLDFGVNQQWEAYFFWNHFIQTNDLWALRSLGEFFDEINIAAPEPFKTAFEDVGRLYLRGSAPRKINSSRFEKSNNYEFLFEMMFMFTEFGGVTKGEASGIVNLVARGRGMIDKKASYFENEFGVERRAVERAKFKKLTEIKGTKYKGQCEEIYPRLAKSLKNDLPANSGIQDEFWGSPRGSG